MSGDHSTMLKASHQIDEEDEDEEPVFLRETFGGGGISQTVYKKRASNRGQVSSFLNPNTVRNKMQTAAGEEVHRMTFSRAKGAQ